VLRKDFYGSVMHLRKTAVDIDRWTVSSRTGKYTKSIDRVPTGGLTKSYASGFSSGSRQSAAKGSTSSPSKSKFPKCLNDKTFSKHGETDYHYVKNCPTQPRTLLWSC
jgi:hypothetical protein